MGNEYTNSTGSDCIGATVNYDGSNGTYGLPGTQTDSAPMGGLEVQTKIAELENKFGSEKVAFARDAVSQGIKPGTSKWGEFAKKSKFTLIELLVVVGIISILASMLLPALGNARSRAKLTNCMGNKKQIVTAVQTYAGDYDNSMPLWARNTDSTNTIFSGSAYLGTGMLVENKDLSLDVLFCPDINKGIDVKLQKNNFITKSAAGAKTSEYVFGSNQISGLATGSVDSNVLTKIDRVPNPERTVYSVDVATDVACTNPVVGDGNQFWMTHNNRGTTAGTFSGGVYVIKPVNGSILDCRYADLSGGDNPIGSGDGSFSQYNDQISKQ